MVLLKSTQKKKNQGIAYYRCFGNEKLSSLLSRVQGLLIKEGNDLENIILEKVCQIDDLDIYLKKNKKNGVFVVPKKIIKKSKIIKFDGVEPDFMIFVENKKQKQCHVTELKDGCEFDTKSSEAEKKHLDEFIQKNARKLQYTVEGHICCFNAISRKEIVKGFRNKISLDDALTGKEFCKLLKIDYEEIVKGRRKHVRQNLTFFLKTLLEDKKISKQIISILGA